MATKIQINSLAALERLIGNDNELEIEIRNSVVQLFVKKHLKALANKDLMEKAAIAVQNAISDEFLNEIKTDTLYKSTWRFKKEILDNLRSDLQWQAQEELRNLVSEVIEEQKVKDTIGASLNNAAELISNQLTDTVLTKRLDDLVNAKLFEKLGLK